MTCYIVQRNHWTGFCCLQRTSVSVKEAPYQQFVVGAVSWYLGTVGMPAFSLQLFPDLKIIILHFWLQTLPTSTL